MKLGMPCTPETRGDLRVAVAVDFEHERAPSELGKAVTSAGIAEQNGGMTAGPRRDECGCSRA